jgi:hypothetical protein
MLCYRDKTFCPFDSCKKFDTCSIALTEQIQKDANAWWMGFRSKDSVPLSRYAYKPECFESDYMSKSEEFLSNRKN